MHRLRLRDPCSRVFRIVALIEHIVTGRKAHQVCGWCPSMRRPPGIIAPRCFRQTVANVLMSDKPWCRFLISGYIGRIPRHN